MVTGTTNANSGLSIRTRIMKGRIKKTSKNSVGFGVIVLPLTSKGVGSHTNCLYIFNQQAVGMCNFYYPIFSLMYDKCYYSN